MRTAAIEAITGINYSVRSFEKNLDEGERAWITIAGMKTVPLHSVRVVSAELVEFACGNKLNRIHVVQHATKINFTIIKGGVGDKEPDEPTRVIFPEQASGNADARQA